MKNKYWQKTSTLTEEWNIDRNVHVVYSTTTTIKSHHHRLKQESGIDYACSGLTFCFCASWILFAFYCILQCCHLTVQMVVLALNVNLLFCYLFQFFLDNIILLTILTYILPLNVQIPSLQLGYIRIPDYHITRKNPFTL